ncbi:hypothetical protein [Thiothrix lacustris]|uniref:hypothetical protein n=1 Tax=Thiothrix lacustris TaxID=525917 RepID=UPI0027E54D0E|nr:hypothetical protein [Thiothrix lacustris]WMP15849.1 hypothetical protein RCS87_10620 [Thiothrix lacustris]
MNEEIINPTIFQDSEWKIRFYETYEAHNTIYKYINLDLLIDDPDIDGEELLEKTLQLASRQMIVVFCTYIEVLIKDFIFTIFREHPQNMCEYLPKEFKDKCNDLFLNKKTDQEIIDVFANIASQKVFSFNIKQTVNAIEKITGDKIKDSQKYKEELKAIFQFRNQVIHENKYTKQNLEKKIEYIYILLAPGFIGELGRLCDKMNIKRSANIVYKLNSDFLIKLSD